MKKILLCNLIVVFSLLFYSCKDANDISSEGMKDTVKTEGTGSSELESEKATDKDADTKSGSSRESSGENRIQFPKGATQTTVSGHIKGFGNNITYVFEASDGQVLNTYVKPRQGDGNIRINQIISPSGNADGPFGMSMDYKLTETGDWKIILGEDQMAGDPWEGEYDLTIEIK
jgi:hypothetical protein